MCQNVSNFNRKTIRVVSKQEYEIKVYGETSWSPLTVDCCKYSSTPSPIKSYIFSDFPLSELISNIDR